MGTGTSLASPEIPGLYDIVLSVIPDDASDMPINDHALNFDYKILNTIPCAHSKINICGTQITLGRGRSGAFGRDTGRGFCALNTNRPDETGVTINGIRAICVPDQDVINLKHASFLTP